MKHSSAYWATVAQILPVVMLALVVEGRAMARTLARKKRYASNRSLRVGYSALFIINCVGLYVAFQVALAGANGDPIPANLDFVATLALSLGVGTVFLTPILVVGSALVSDSVIALHRRMPYSKVSKELRYATKMYSRITGSIQESRDEILRQRVHISGEYVVAYTHLSGAAGSPTHVKTLHDRLDELGRFWQNLASLERQLDDHEEAVESKMRDAEGRRHLGESDLRISRSLVLQSAASA